MSLESQYATSY